MDEGSGGWWGVGRRRGGWCEGLCLLNKEEVACAVYA